MQVGSTLMKPLRIAIAEDNWLVAEAPALTGQIAQPQADLRASARGAHRTSSGPRRRDLISDPPAAILADCQVSA
jgi:hypothetical protein